MIKSFVKGMVIGIANIVPGVSGGTMMVSMGIYDKLIHCITHLFSEFKQNVLFLLPIALGMQFFWTQLPFQQFSHSDQPAVRRLDPGRASGHLEESQGQRH